MDLMAPDRTQGVAVLGSTGSVGVSTLDVLRRNPESYRVAALAANRRVDLLEAQCVEFEPDFAAMSDPEAASELACRLDRRQLRTELVSGPDSLDKIAAHRDIPVVMASIVGFAGLNSTIAAARHGKRILLANKESMVVAGNLLANAVRDGGATIVPVDSEHNAIFQCLPGANQRGVPVCEDNQIISLILTASGGPFRLHSSDEMGAVTVAQAVNHPNWDMGPKISVDSATMMNKGLEIIEACFLFGIDESRIEVVVHPQSVIHSMVRFKDGSILAQMGEPDMRTPIANALAWPARIDAGVSQLDFCSMSALEFTAPDEDRFPCLALARQAIRLGGGANVVLNAANEVAVSMFLNKEIRFVDIASVNAHVLRHCLSESPDSVSELRSIDGMARRFAEDYIANGLNSVGLV